jgi:hypothetical protein
MNQRLRLRPVQRQLVLPLMRLPPLQTLLLP